MSTVVTQGRGLAVITATGMQTELGRIADLLQRRLDQVGKTLAVVGAAIAALIFTLVCGVVTSCATCPSRL